MRPTRPPTGVTQTRGGHSAEKRREYIFQLAQCTFTPQVPGTKPDTK